jgi:hypothetical protein
MTSGITEDVLASTPSPREVKAIDNPTSSPIDTILVAPTKKTKWTRLLSNDGSQGPRMLLKLGLDGVVVRVPTITYNAADNSFQSQTDASIYSRP